MDTAPRSIPASLSTSLLLSTGLMLGACGGRAESPPVPGPDPAPEAPELEAAPWSGPELPADAVPAPYLEAWGDADNRLWCALLAFDDPPRGEGAEARTAQFGGGWGVAYDLPDRRSAFGVAGTGAEPGPGTYDDWPHHREWRDGSRVGYGPEGGTGPNLLAYLEVSGEGCLYNVWSRLGLEHLESLLESLRRVEDR